MDELCADCLVLHAQLAEAKADLELQVKATDSAMEAASSHLARADAAEAKLAEVSAFAAKLVGNACERHTAEAKAMSFDAFYAQNPKGCAWCADAEVARLRGALGIIANSPETGDRRYSTCMWCTANSDEWEDHKEECPAKIARAALSPPADGSGVVVLTEEERARLFKSVDRYVQCVPMYREEEEEYKRLAAKFAKEGK